MQPELKKRVKRHFTVLEKETVLNIFSKRQQECPADSKTRIVDFTAEAAGICSASVFNILREHNAQDVKPPKTYTRTRSVLDNIDDDMRNIIRRIVHSFFYKNEVPTVDKILIKVNEDENLPNLKRTTLWKLLKEMNFSFKKRARNSFLKEKCEIVTWRRRYLRQIKEFREQNKKNYYLDETWVNEGHTVQKIWVDETVTSPRQALLQGLSTGLKNPTGKGRRLIVLHIGSEDGFVENGLLLFESKRTNDYHEEMNANIFEEWFEKVLPTLEKECVVVLDNASYHSRKIEKVPTTATRKGDIQSWLQEKNISFQKDMVKDELLHLVKVHKENFNKYAIDELAKTYNRTVLRLPPYHCELNPIELIWAQVKGEIARKNTTFKLKEVKELLDTSLNNVTKENWLNAIKHVKEIEKNMWELDVIVENLHDNFIINLDSSESSDSDIHE